VALSIGTVIGGRYRLDRLLGEGGMGQVWAATHNITGGRVALKFVKAVGDAKAEVHKRFLREARAATLVEHPNVVTIRDVFDHDETPVIVMDLLHGETLAALLSREGKLDLGDAARLILPVIAAVGAAHEAGLIHRDLKPENVFLSKGQTGEMVRVLDFGIANSSTSRPPPSRRAAP
jgi:eukaryotic-like serine/threonine-protein kinase